jgi:hypothetical protein
VPNRDELNPPIDRLPIRRRPVPAEVTQLRTEATADDDANSAVAQPRIEAVLTACELVAQQLEDLHRACVDMTDLDPAGYSRAGAIWLLSGRILGLHRALLAQAEAGIGDEAAVTGRAIHEACRVLFAFSVPDEQEIVRLWLDDEGRHGYVKQGEARAAERRYEEALAAAMERVGLSPIDSAIGKTEEMYDKLSRVAHSRRSSCLASWWNPGRQMAYGVQSSAIRRAGAVSWASSMTGEVVNAVGDALRALYSQPQFFSEQIAPLQKALDAVRESAPLDETSIRQAASTA